MKIDLEFAKLPSPLFLAGVNFGDKLYPNSKGGIKMWYDTDLDLLIVCYNGKTGLIKHTDSMTMYDASQLGINPTVEKKAVLTPVPGPIFTGNAQVENPTTKAPKTIRRPAKYQGEEASEE